MSSSRSFARSTNSFEGRELATLLPSGLAIVSVLFPDTRLRARAIGIFAVTFAAGFAIGPLLGGMLLSQFEWNAVFLINVPVVLGFLIAAPVLLREMRSTTHGRIDLPSLLLSFVGILLFTWSLKNVAAEGFTATQSVAGIIGILALALLLRRQTRIDYPLLDLNLFRDRIFSTAIMTGLLSLLVWSAASYLSGIYLQSVLGFDVFTAALLTLPGAIVLTATCVGSDAPADKRGRLPAAVHQHRGRRCGLHRFNRDRRCRIRAVFQPCGRNRGLGGSCRTSWSCRFDCRDQQRVGECVWLLRSSDRWPR